ncbi:MAG: hypothetical protein ACE5HB_00670 [Terriglobia bacterium]
MFASTYETGQAWLRREKPDVARTYFELAAEAAPGSPMPFYQLARVHALTGKKKQALQALERAVANGLKNPQLLLETDEFAALRESEQFRQLLARLETEAVQ